MVAKTCGAGFVAILGISSDEHIRFSAARKLGVDLTVNVMKKDPMKILLYIADGRMSDVVVEANGSEEGIKSAFMASGKCSRICAVGLTGNEKTSIPWDLGQSKMLDVYFNMSSSFTSWGRAASLIENTPYDLSNLITHIGGIDCWESSFNDIQKGKAIKAMFIQ